MATTDPMTKRLRESRAMARRMAPGRKSRISPWRRMPAACITSPTVVAPTMMAMKIHFIGRAPGEKISPQRRRDTEEHLRKTSDGEVDHAASYLGFESAEGAENWSQPGKISSPQRRRDTEEHLRKTADGQVDDAASYLGFESTEGAEGAENGNQPGKSSSPQRRGDTEEHLRKTADGEVDDAASYLGFESAEGAEGAENWNQPGKNLSPQRRRDTENHLRKTADGEADDAASYLGFESTEGAEGTENGNTRWVNEGGSFAGLRGMGAGGGTQADEGDSGHDQDDSGPTFQGDPPP